MGDSLNRFIFILLVFYAVLQSAPSFAANQRFQQWLSDLRQQAHQQGISQQLIEEALPYSLTPNEKILRLDRKQPENAISFEKYKKNVIAALRLQQGRHHMQREKALLNKISTAYGVEPQYIVALWGMETSFGQNTGGFDTIPALVTLAYDGRRSAFFRTELLKALKIVDDGHIPLHKMKGSWAGAMGQCQFMPSSYQEFSQDHNKDGKSDIWNTKSDVFASVAQYLSKSGWKNGQPLMRQVTLPENFDPALAKMAVKKPLHEWFAAGVRVADNKHLIVAPEGPVSIIQPGGKGYKAYIVYDNYRILMKWNYSTYFATAVALFAEQLK